jgi:arylsulfatase A-like enzyme
MIDLMKTHLTALALILSVDALGGSHLLPSKDTSRPNVIVIMTDDQGNNVGYEGNPHVRTPHMDKMASEAVRLTNFHQMPMCTASRAALMTGKYAEQTGAWRTSLGRTLMRADNLTIAEAFKANGYETGHFGKWHLGDAWPMRPQDQGFDEVVGLRCGAISQIADYWGNDYFDDTYYHNGIPKKYEGYCTDVFFNETMRYIKGVKDKPFFVYLAPNVTHLPLKVADHYTKHHLANGVNEKLAVFYGMVDNLDENVGRLSAFLKQEGLDDNTIILFTTDDGTQGAALSQTEKPWFKGMRGKKGSREEGGHRVFCFLRWPASLESWDNGTIISVLDVYPTLLDLCGFKVPGDIKIEGRSFKPYLANPLDAENDERMVFFYYYNAKNLNDRDKYLCVIWKNWRMLGEGQLYDIKKDRMQENDVAAEYPEVVQRMEKAFQAYHARGKELVQEPVRFILGGVGSPAIEITGQDMYWTPESKGGQPFGQSAPRDLMQAHGPYKVRIAREGKYRFTLSRYPLYTNMPMSIGGRKFKKDHIIRKVRISIAGKTREKVVMPEDTRATFLMNLKVGDADLSTALLGDGKDGIAYFVTAEYLGK